MEQHKFRSHARPDGKTVTVCTAHDIRMGSQARGSMAAECDRLRAVHPNGMRLGLQEATA